MPYITVNSLVAEEDYAKIYADNTRLALHQDLLNLENEHDSNLLALSGKIDSLSTKVAPLEGLPTQVGGLSAQVGPLVKTVSNASSTINASNLVLRDAGGNIFARTQVDSDNSKKVATTEFVKVSIAKAINLEDVVLKSYVDNKDNLYSKNLGKCEIDRNAVPKTIAVRGDAGELNVGPATTGTSAINYDHLESKLLTKQDRIPWDIPDNENNLMEFAVAVRNAEGSLVTGVPTSSDHATTKQYVDDALASKANALDVTNSLNLKANQADVTTALTSKADKTDVTDGLNLKAAKSELDHTKLKFERLLTILKDAGNLTQSQIETINAPVS